MSKALKNQSMAVVIVNYNTREHLRACLASVRAETPLEVVVVDNASSDGSVAMMQAEYPSVVLHANQSNLGYGAAANQAIASCTAKYVLLLNADTLLQPGTLKALTKYLDHNPGAAIVGPRLLERDGSLQASCYPFPTPINTFLENSTLAIFLGRGIRRYIPAVRNLYLRTWAHSETRIVPWIKGAAMAIRREAYDSVDGFDESFFLYFEDADLCYRLGIRGWQVHFTPAATVVHLGGASTAQNRSDMLLQIVASNLKFYERHCSRNHCVQVIMIFKGLMLAKWFGGAFRYCFSRDANKRSEIATNLTASQRVLVGNWRSQATQVSAASNPKLHSEHRGAEFFKPDRLPIDTDAE